MTEPAFPVPIFQGEHLVDSTEGLTKREYFAAKAMQGLLSSQTEDWYADPSGTAKMAVQLADALIKKLNN